MQGLRDNESGVAAIEFALVGPAFIGLVLGGLEYSFILFTQNSSQNAARDVGRQLATARIATSAADNAVRSQLPSWASSSAVITVSQSAPSDPATNAYSVTVSLPTQKATPFNFLTWTYEGKKIVTKTVFQQEVDP